MSPTCASSPTSRVEGRYTRGHPQQERQEQQAVTMHPRLEPQPLKQPPLQPLPMPVAFRTSLAGLSAEPAPSGSWTTGRATADRSPVEEWTAACAPSRTS
mmetsp:Transcript_125440/g.217502  ORF Transcript_125440/g.217502 Transcript_125440/m.217502 type:complete len:100 (-) Transcript_125440:459-758(-)